MIDIYIYMCDHVVIKYETYIYIIDNIYIQIPYRVMAIYTSFILHMFFFVNNLRAVYPWGTFLVSITRLAAPNLPIWCRSIDLYLDHISG